MELRLIPVSGNPKRNRNMFLFDGKAVHRPGINDTIPSGRLDVFQEDRRTFRLDLRTLKHNPRIDLSNIMALQFFWSSTPVVGETVFYFDDVQLLTDEDLEKEKKDGRRRQLAELRNMIPDSKIKQWEGEIRVLEQWLDAGKYETLDQGVTALKEKIVNSLVLGNEDLRIVAVNSSEKVMRDTIFPYRNFPVQISAAGNERESFQAVLALSRPLKQVRFTAGELRSEGGKVIPAGKCPDQSGRLCGGNGNDFFHPSSRTGFWPDIVHRNRPFDLPERVQPFMVTVAVPAGQPAGIYTGKLTLTVDGMESRTVEYRVKVYSFSLPRKGKAKTFISFNYAPDDPALRRRVYDLVFDYRLNPVSMYPKLFKKKVNTRFLPFPEDLDYCLRKGMNFMAFGFMEDQQAKDSQCFDEEYIQAVLKWIGRWRPFLKRKERGSAYMMGLRMIMHR
ncbi:MAG: hypothetical protein V8T87_09180 [Victivallales bacterium]